MGTKLKVTPQVNEGDAVLLEIEQEVSSVDSSSNSTLGPTFNTRTIQNAVLVKTGETVVLGALLDGFSKGQVSKVPLLGDIPLVGQLFRYTSTERAKRNLMVFIRPTIIRDDDVYRSLSKEKYTRYRQEQQQRIDGKSKALVGSEDLPVLDENTPMQILIGPENVSEALKDASVVVASYDIGDNMRGLIGVVGPTRMDYATVAARLSYFAESLTKMFGKNNQLPPKEDDIP